MRRKPNNRMNNNNNNNNNNNHRRRFHRGENNTGKIKSASANRDKYLNMARDAMASGDRVEAENYLQHAEHYFRVLSFLQEEDARNRPERTENQDANMQDTHIADAEEGEETADAAEAAGDDNNSDALAIAS